MARILVAGDAPYLKTGFGRVNSHAVKALLDDGHTVASVTGLTLDDPKEPVAYEIFHPEQGDVIGQIKLGEVIQEWKPDLVYVTGEPGLLTAYAKVVPARIPVVSYCPIEGEPILAQDWKAVLAGVNLITCSEYGAKVVKEFVGTDIPWAYHGIDHDVFRVNGRRDEIRRMFGWENKFVIITVAANVKRKQHPRLFEAVSLLVHQYKQDDIVLYDHTIPFDRHWLEGWNLPAIAHGFKIENHVVFNPLYKSNLSAIPEVAPFDGVGLVDLYNAADLFVLPSQVEGFGLPIAEAMACGVPVMVTRYAAGWEVARPAGVGIPVIDWETHKSGTRYANVDVKEMASQILALKRNPKERAKRSALGLQRVRDFDWSHLEEVISGYVRDTLTKTNSQEIQSVNSTQESEDQDQEPGQATTTGHENGYENQVEDRPETQQAEPTLAGTNVRSA
jgi:glycosyltransferase involved in cell wall biosynthesis